MQQDCSVRLPKLFIFTLTFPFSGAAESNFLIPELKVLEKSFEIILVPRKLDGVSEKTFGEYRVDLSFATLMSSTKPRGLNRIRRLFQFDFFFELFRLFPKSINFRLASTVAVDHLLGSFAMDWVKLNKELINESRSIIYGWWLTPEILKIASSRRLKTTVVVARAHRGDLYEFRDKYGIKPFRSRYIANLNGLYPISNDGRIYLLERFRGIEQITSVQHLGTDDYGLGAQPVSGSKVFQIVSCSFVTQIKQLHVAVMGISEFASSFPDVKVKWTHFGVGPESEALAENALKAGLFEFEIREFNSIEELAFFYQTVPVNVFINTSKSEGVPVTMIEAASFGIPLIGPSVGGVNEILKHGENGYMMSPESSPHALCLCLRQLINLDSRDYAMLRDRSRSIWSTQFRSDHVYIAFASQLMQI